MEKFKKKDTFKPYSHVFYELKGLLLLHKPNKIYIDLVEIKQTKTMHHLYVI